MHSILFLLQPFTRLELKRLWKIPAVYWACIECSPIREGKQMAEGKVREVPLTKPRPSATGRAWKLEVKQATPLALCLTRGHTDQSSPASLFTSLGGGFQVASPAFLQRRGPSIKNSFFISEFCTWESDHSSSVSCVSFPPLHCQDVVKGKNFLGQRFRDSYLFKKGVKDVRFKTRLPFIPVVTKKNALTIDWVFKIQFNTQCI